MAHLNSVIPKHISAPLPAPATCQVVAEFSLLRLMCCCGLRVKSRHSMEKSNTGPSDHLLMREKCQPHLPWMQDAVRERPDRERWGMEEAAAPAQVQWSSWKCHDLIYGYLTAHITCTRVRRDTCSERRRRRLAALSLPVLPQGMRTHTQTQTATHAAAHTCRKTHLVTPAWSDFWGLPWARG